MTDRLRISPEVREALASRRPIVAFESTIISHGMPYPRNRDTAMTAESIVRASGAVPATVAVLDGRLAVGLSADELERLATENGRAEGLPPRPGLGARGRPAPGQRP